MFANCVHIRLSKLIYYMVQRTETKERKHRKREFVTLK